MKVLLLSILRSHLREKPNVDSCWLDWTFFSNTFHRSGTLVLNSMACAWGGGCLPRTQWRTPISGPSWSLTIPRRHVSLLEGSLSPFWTTLIVEKCYFILSLISRLSIYIQYMTFLSVSIFNTFCTINLLYIWIEWAIPDLRHHHQQKNCLPYIAL